MVGMDSRDDLERWFSPQRMSTYAHHRDPEDLYLWNTRLTKAFLEDIQHIEVLLRNCVDAAVSPRYGSQWYDSPKIPLSGVARRSVDKAKHRASRHQKRSPLPGQVIAELSFDFWTYLFIERYRSTLWPLIQNQLHTTRLTATGGEALRISPSLEEFRFEVDVVYRLRNRCAHHEPIVRPQQAEEDAYLDRCETAINNVARWIDPDAAQWVDKHSRVSSLRKTRPL